MQPIKVVWHTTEPTFEATLLERAQTGNDGAFYSEKWSAYYNKMHKGRIVAFVVKDHETYAIVDHRHKLREIALELLTVEEW